jgi:peptidoglycan/LPS O-acetylase OafA/YrhL
MNNENYFKPLTGYRALAAFLVFIHHFSRFDRGSFLDAFTIGFSIGVPLFFVLSGFLIYTRYNTMAVSISFYKRYFLNRFARIYPLYFLITTLTLLYTYGSDSFSPHWLSVYLLNITFLRGYIESLLFSLVAAGWTLTVEETFYILAPLLFSFAGDSIKKYMLAFLIIFGCGWLLSFISIDLLHGLPWHSHKFMVMSTFFGHSFAFVIGIIVGILNNRLKDIPFKYSTIVGFAGLIVCLLLMSQFIVIPPGEGRIFSWRWIFVYEFLVTPFIGAIIWGLIHERTYISRLLSTDTFQILGKSSYAFYLIHYGILYSILCKYISCSGWIQFPITLAISILLWKFIEEPLNLRIRKRLFPG